MVDLTELRGRVEGETHPYFIWWWQQPMLDVINELERLRKLRDGYQGEGKIPYV